jgi:hypothetical protein
MLISRTMPSKVSSMLKRFWEVNIPPPAGAAIVGVINSVLPILLTSGANASFGALAGLVVEVTHATSAPVAAAVHPAGSAGATTPSKFCEKVAPHGVGVGLAVGVGVGVGATVAVAVGVGEGVPVAVAVAVGVGVGVAEPLHSVNLKLPMRVLQLNWLVVA